MCLDNYVNIKDQHLISFSFNVSGDMRGGYYHMIVKGMDESNALIRIEDSEAFNTEPIIQEYTVDINIITELENVIRKYKMNHWNNKKFTDMFVSDGASYGYCFKFDKDFINFSSQIYPQNYRLQLKELDAIIKSYIDKQGE